MSIWDPLDQPSLPFSFIPHQSPTLSSSLPHTATLGHIFKALHLFPWYRELVLLCLENSSEFCLGGGAQLKGHLLQVLFDHFHLEWPSLRNFSSCPVVKTQSFISGGSGSVLGWETKIVYAAECGQKLIKSEKKYFKSGHLFPHFCTPALPLYPLIS